MPRVDVMYRKGKISVGQFPLIKVAIKATVVEHLACEDPDGSLTTSDVEVFFHEVGPYDDFQDYDLAFGVTANSYPSRETNRDERTDKIKDSLGAVLTRMRWHGKWYAWVLLTSATFREDVIE